MGYDIGNQIMFVIRAEQGAGHTAHKKKRHEIIIFTRTEFGIMDIQAEKLQLIEWLARVNDIKIIQEIKSLKTETDKNLFKRYTNQDLVTRAEDSMKDIENGETTKLSDFKHEIATWKQTKDTR